MTYDAAAEQARKVAEEIGGKDVDHVDTPVRPAACPVCEVVLTGAMSVFEAASPEVGDATICIGCGTICLYTEEMTLRLPTKTEMFEIVRILGKKLNKPA